MNNANVYTALGVKRRINAAGTLTRLGGSLMAPEVIDAMVAAARWSERFASQNVLIVDPQALQPEDDEAVAGAIRSALAGGPSTRSRF